MGISFKDARRLWSSIWRNEELVNKKRRWLMLLPSHESKLSKKKLKKPKSLLNVFLAESFARSDEISPMAVKINVEKSYGASCDTEEMVDEVHNYMVLADMHILQSYLLNPSSIMKFYSTLDLLSKNALGLLANLVSEDKSNLNGSRSSMKEVIKSHFPKSLSASIDEALVATLQQLIEILRNLKSYFEKQPNLLTHRYSSTQLSIYRALESLDSMPLFALCALNRRLNDVKRVPQFPPSKLGYNKREFVKRIKKRCQILIPTLNNANSMPEKLLKALSLIHLYFIYKTKCSDTRRKSLFSFSEEIVILQNNILKALWSLNKVTLYQLNALQSILHHKLGDDSSKFLNDLKHYLVEYLFNCDEIDVPRDISSVLTILNQRSCFQGQICSKEIIEVETNAILIVSSELKQIVSHLDSSYTCLDEIDSEKHESGNDTTSSEFQFVESYYCSNPSTLHQQKHKDFSINCELEATGDSMPGTGFISSTNNGFCDFYSSSLKCIESGFVKTLNESQDDIHELSSQYEESMETSLENTRVPNGYGDISIKELCDETSLVSYRIIGQMLYWFLLAEGQDVGVAAKHLLTGEASPYINSQDDEDILDASVENASINVLMHSINDILPFIPKRCIQKVKKLLMQS